MTGVRLSADGGTTSFDLSRDTRVALVTDPAGFQTRYEHDADGHPVAVVDPAGHRTELTYVGGVGPGGVERRDGLLALVTPPRGNAVEMEYDRVAGQRGSQFNLKRVRRHPTTGSADQKLVTEIPEYDGHNLPKRLVAADGQVTEIRRDGKGDPDRILLSGTDPITVSTDGHGRVTSVAGTARAVTLGYDDDPGRSGGLRRAEVAGGERVTLDRDTRGNVTSITDGTLRQTRLSWNALDQLEREEQGAGPAGAEASVEYDALGLPVRSSVRLSAPEGEPPVYTESRYDFDSLGRLSSVTASDAGTVALRYDSRGNLAAVEDAAGGRVGFGYEARGLLQTVTDPSGAVTTLARNANGTPESIQDPRGRVVRFLLDGHERVVGTNDSAGSVTSVVRDAAGRVRVSKVFDKDADGAPKDLFSWTEFDYDAGGRPVRRTRKLFETPAPEPVAVDVVTEWKRDGAGRVTEEIDPLGRVTRTTWDGAGRVSLVADAAGNEVSLEYDGAGRKVTGDAPGPQGRRLVRGAGHRVDLRRPGTGLEGHGARRPGHHLGVRRAGPQDEGDGPRRERNPLRVRPRRPAHEEDRPARPRDALGIRRPGKARESRRRPGERDDLHVRRSGTPPGRDARRAGQLPRQSLGPAHVVLHLGPAREPRDRQRSERDRHDVLARRCRAPHRSRDPEGARGRRRRSDLVHPRRPGPPRRRLRYGRPVAGRAHPPVRLAREGTRGVTPHRRGTRASRPPLLRRRRQPGRAHLSFGPHDRAGLRPAEPPRRGPLGRGGSPRAVRGPRLPSAPQGPRQRPGRGETVRRLGLALASRRRPLLEPQRHLLGHLRQERPLAEDRRRPRGPRQAPPLRLRRGQPDRPRAARPRRARAASAEPPRSRDLPDA